MTVTGLEGALRALIEYNNSYESETHKTSLRLTYDSTTSNFGTVEQPNIFQWIYRWIFSTKPESEQIDKIVQAYASTISESTNFQGVNIQALQYAHRGLVIFSYRCGGNNRQTIETIASLLKNTLHKNGAPTLHEKAFEDFTQTFEVPSHSLQVDKALKIKPQSVEKSPDQNSLQWLRSTYQSLKKRTTIHPKEAKDSFYTLKNGEHLLAARRAEWENKRNLWD